MLDDWRPIATAPIGQDLQLSVIEDGEVHALVFPCRKVVAGWRSMATGAVISLDPTHWRPWPRQNETDRTAGARPPPRLQ
jgi:hypothetical protein